MVLILNVKSGASKEPNKEEKWDAQRREYERRIQEAEQRAEKAEQRADKEERERKNLEIQLSLVQYRSRNKRRKK
ncbi:sucrose porin [Acrasis kona]|uniref:Sucrose porin n=1 Tax=Acrasis kona TaxID=1008807 RepID=A0AAW2Z6Z6_9EUKA